MSSLNDPLKMVRGSFIFSCLVILALCLGRVSADDQISAIDPEEREMLKLINEYRLQNGLTLLKFSSTLTRAANWMGTDMTANNYFRHVDSLGRKPVERMTAFGYKFPGYNGENLAAGYSDAARTFNQWKQSPGHNANMLNRNYRVIGISRVFGEDTKYKWYWTTNFGSYVDRKIARN
ncbi:MAG TPA: CAP domain-containing protein [Blastocatellia bacterium]|nr:CAP domain-containing protein [Blastocatellia bacterium]